jgi:hypothetical protein
MVTENLLPLIRVIGWDGMDWIDLAQYRDQWRALVNTVMKLQIPENAGKFWVAAELAASQESLSYMCESHLRARVSVTCINILCKYVVYSVC